MSFMFPPLPKTKFRLLQDYLLDQLDEKTIKELVDIVVAHICDPKQIENPVLKRLFKNLGTVLPRAELQKSVSKFLKQIVCPLPEKLTKTSFAFHGAQFWEFVGIGWSSGTAADQLGFSDWWYEWNAELDEAFFDWIDETFGSDGDGEMGDYPEPPPGYSYG